MARVYIPTSLRKWTGGLSHIPTRAETVGVLFQELEQQFPGLWNELFDADGNLHRFVNVYVNDEDIRFLKNLETPVKTGDEISIVPAIAGGNEVQLC